MHSLWPTDTCISRQFSWILSQVLEAFAVLPQLLLLRQTNVPTVLDSFYLVTLGVYRAFYLLNWLLRAIQHQEYDPVSVIFGTIQTALYVDFAWVYWGRQRVKLRAGRVIDKEDYERGWIVKRLIGDGRRMGVADEDDDGDDGQNGHTGRTGNGTGGRKGWGNKGISVSADEGIRASEEGRLADPENFEDDLSDGEDSHAPAQTAGKTTVEDAVGDGAEWRK